MNWGCDACATKSGNGGEERRKNDDQRRYIIIRKKKSSWPCRILFCSSGEYGEW